MNIIKGFGWGPIGSLPTYKDNTFYRSENNVIILDLSDPSTSGWAIKQIEGLNPINADINTEKYAIMDGSALNGVSVNTRNIVITINFQNGFIYDMLNSDSSLSDTKKVFHDIYGDEYVELVDGNYKINNYPTIQDIRRTTYKHFHVKMPIRLFFIFNERKKINDKWEEHEIAYFIDAVVENNQPNIFSNSEETQISFLCPEPYFKLYDDQSYHMLQPHKGLFQFERNNGPELPRQDEEHQDELEWRAQKVFSGFEETEEGLQEVAIPPYDIKRTVFGEYLETGLEKIIPYESYIDTGVSITLICNSTMYSGKFVFNIKNDKYGNQTLVIDLTKASQLIGGMLSKGDMINISSISGNRRITIYHNGQYYNATQLMDRYNIIWLQLSQGDNKVSYLLDGYERDYYDILFEYNLLFEGL